MSYLNIPWQSLSPDALHGVIEEFVSRDGTDYGSREVNLADKVGQVRRQLQRGEVVIVFDQAEGRCQLVTAEAIKGQDID